MDAIQEMKEVGELKEILVDVQEFTVRFSEVDSMRIVWHGNYVRYFEDGREAFGSKYGLHYLDVYENDLVTPIVKLSCDYKRPLRFGDSFKVETTYVDGPAAKIHFKYRIFRSENDELVCEGESVQVFLNTEGELQLTYPTFFSEWKKKWGLKYQ